MPPAVRTLPPPPHAASGSSRRPHELSDAAVLARLAEGDAEAAREFVGRYQRRVYGLAFTILGDRRAAEDVAQEALLRAWRHAGTFDSTRGNAASWVLAIARNAAVDATRVRRPVAVDPDDLLALSLESSERDPGDAAVVSDDASRLRHALVELPEAQRRAVVLAGMWGLSAREIAEREGIPIGTAKTRIRAALRRLRGELSDA
ncbi:MAG TPA: RNA polymerase sigma factor [Acidimicrobiia bacterium]